MRNIGPKVCLVFVRSRRPLGAYLRTDPAHSIDALTTKIGTLSIEAQAKLEQDTAKKEQKADAKADADLKKKMVRTSQVFEPLSSSRYHFFNYGGESPWWCIDFTVYLLWRTCA